MDQDYAETGIDQSFYEQDNQSLRTKNNELNTAIANSSFMKDNRDENLILHQLDTDAILEKIQRYLRGDIIRTDGQSTWYEIPKDPKLRNLNEYGVAEMMRIISNYVCKETLLSNYDIERVYEILADLGDELAKFLYCNYEKIGLVGEYKRTKFELMVLPVLHLVESTYRRALGGEERDNIKTGRIITQSQPLNQGMGLKYDH